MVDERYENNNLPELYNDNITEIAERAEKRIEAVKKIKTLSLRVTNTTDWTDQGGKPYLQVSGAEKVARLFGISWRIDAPSYLLEEDGHFTFEFKGYFSMGNVEIEAIGTRSSRDPFFSGSKNNPKPPSEVDMGNVKKAAYTNCIGNGVTRLLGIRNLSWDDLKEAGIDREKVSKIEYKTGEMSEEVQKLREEIRSMLMEMCGGDEKKFAAALKKVTSFAGKDGKTIPGKSKLEELSEKAIPVNYEKVKKAYDEWKAGQKGEAAPNGSDSDNQ